MAKRQTAAPAAPRRSALIIPFPRRYQPPPEASKVGIQDNNAVWNAGFSAGLSLIEAMLERGPK